MRSIVRAVLKIGMFLCPLASIAAPTDNMRTSELPNVLDLVDRLRNSPNTDLQDEALQWRLAWAQRTQSSTNVDSSWRKVQESAKSDKLTPDVSEKSVLARALLERFKQLRRQGRLPKELADQAEINPEQVLAYFKQNADALGDLKDLVHGAGGLDDASLKREVSSLASGGKLDVERESTLIADNTDSNSYKNYESAARSEPVKYEDTPMMSAGLPFNGPSETKSSKVVVKGTAPLPPVVEQSAAVLPELPSVASAPTTAPLPAMAPLPAATRIASTRSLASAPRTESSAAPAAHSFSSESSSSSPRNDHSQSVKSDTNDEEKIPLKPKIGEAEKEPEAETPEKELAEKDKTIADLQASCGSGGNACRDLAEALKDREEYVASHAEAVSAAPVPRTPSQSAARPASSGPKGPSNPIGLIDTSYFPQCPRGIKPMNDLELKSYIAELRRQNEGSITSLERLQAQLNRVKGEGSYWSADKSINMGCVAALHRQQQKKYGLLNGKRDCGRLPSSPECKCEKELNKINPASIWDRVVSAQAPGLDGVSQVLTGNQTRYRDVCKDVISGKGDFATKEASHALMALSHMTQGEGLYYQLVLGSPSAACAALNPVQAFNDRNKDISYYPDGLDDQCREISVKRPEDFNRMTNLDRIQILSALRYFKSVASVANRYDPPKTCGDDPMPASETQSSTAKSIHQKTIRLMRILDTERETSLRDGREIALQDVTGREVRHPSLFVTGTQMNGLYNSLMRCTKPGQLGWAFMMAEKELRDLAKQCDARGEASNFSDKSMQEIEKAACDMRDQSDMNLLAADSAQLLRVRYKIQIANDCTEIRLRGGASIVNAPAEQGHPVLFYGQKYCPSYPPTAFDDKNPIIMNGFLHTDRVRRNRIWQNFVGAKVNYGVPIDAQEYYAYQVSSRVPNDGRIDKGILKGAVFSSCSEIIDTHRAMMYTLLNRMAFSDERLNQRCPGSDGGIKGMNGRH